MSRQVVQPADRHLAPLGACPRIGASARADAADPSPRPGRCGVLPPRPLPQRRRVRSSAGTYPIPRPNAGRSWSVVTAISGRDQSAVQSSTPELAVSPSAVPETSRSRRVTRQPPQHAQARQLDFGLPPPGTRPFPRPGLPAAMSSTGAVPSGRHGSGGYTNRADRNHDLAGGGPASPGRVESAPFHRRTSGRVLPDSVELDEMTSRTTQTHRRGRTCVCSSRGPGDRSTTLLHRGLASQQLWVGIEQPWRPYDRAGPRPRTDVGPTRPRIIRGLNGLAVRAANRAAPNARGNPVVG
jgi:hypothetical protein